MNDKDLPDNAIYNALGLHDPDGVSVWVCVYTWMCVKLVEKMNDKDLPDNAIYNALGLHDPDGVSVCVCVYEKEILCMYMTLIFACAGRDPQTIQGWKMEDFQGSWSCLQVCFHACTHEFNFCIYIYIYIYVCMYIWCGVSC